MLRGVLDDLGPDLLAQLLKDRYCCSPVRIGGRKQDATSLLDSQDTFVSKCHPQSAILGRGEELLSNKDCTRRVAFGHYFVVQDVSQKNPTYITLIPH